MALTAEEQRRLTQSGAAVPVALAGGLGGPPTLTNTFPGNRLTGTSPYVAPAAAAAPAGAAPLSAWEVVRNGVLGRPAAQPAVAPVVNTAPDFSAALGGNPALIAANAAAMPAAQPATQAQVRAVDNSLEPPLYTPPQFADTTPGAATAAATSAAAAVPAQPGSAEAQTQQQAATGGLGGPEDTRRRLAALEASNAQVAAGARGPVLIDNGNPNRNADFNDSAALRTAAARTTTTRRGTTMDPAAQVYSDQLLGRARERTAAEGNAASLAQTNIREAGDTTRAGMREAGANTRAAAANTVEQARLTADQQRVAIAAREQQNRDTAAGYDNATRQRIEAVQQEIATAKTPEARRAAAEKLAALTGKATQDNFAALELGGGSTVDPTTGIAVPQPKSAIIYNKATGTYEQLGGAGTGAPQARGAIAEGTISTVNGKSARYTGGKWVPL